MSSDPQYLIKAQQAAHICNLSPGSGQEAMETADFPESIRQPVWPNWWSLASIRNLVSKNIVENNEINNTNLWYTHAHAHISHTHIVHVHRPLPQKKKNIENFCLFLKENLSESSFFLPFNKQNNHFVSLPKASVAGGGRCIFLFPSIQHLLPEGLLCQQSTY